MDEFRDIKGGKELMELLDKLPDEVAMKVMRDSLRAGGKAYSDEIKLTQAYTDQTGITRADTTVGVSRRLRDSFLRGVVAVGRKTRRKGRGPVPSWLEFGTSKMAARPFVRPAFDSASGRAIQAVMNEARYRLTVLANKLAKAKGRA